MLPSLGAAALAGAVAGAGTNFVATEPCRSGGSLPRARLAPGPVQWCVIVGLIQQLDEGAAPEGEAEAAEETREERRAARQPLRHFREPNG